MLLIKGIRFHGYHGVHEAEREIGQKYEVDLSICANLDNACENDDLSGTIDYSEIVELVIEIGTTSKFQLFEALAHRIATEILKQFPIEMVEITLKKLTPPITHSIDYAGVRILRKRNEIDPQS